MRIDKEVRDLLESFTDYELALALTELGGHKFKSARPTDEELTAIGTRPTRKQTVAGKKADLDRLNSWIAERRRQHLVRENE